jgi:hypothetical protein
MTTASTSNLHSTSNSRPVAVADEHDVVVWNEIIRLR